jgi:hypothetical protein
MKSSIDSSSRATVRFIGASPVVPVINYSASFQRFSNDLAVEMTKKQTLTSSTHSRGRNSLRLFS